MDEILCLLYSKKLHPRTRKLLPIAKKALEVLIDEREVQRERLAKLLGLNLNNPTEKKRFYAVISPLFNKLVISKRKEQHTTTSRKRVRSSYLFL
ncbi:MAG: hypothetical protein DRJ33_07900 [Candidatus Methanomethylicota archaeon]|uniref:Uncharacterized protein n=1 Tax=Thermoproteota archaeon TaxID=2056631 RepID=A0A497ER28_9CREN|nr:MAG: hypothetical protein DRJ33_07900 [Candidatus Verstraetearchaeota archaeon]RLG72142.1 MAG: hypothetical protein DRO23_10910 [Thermoprotei archaeon]